MNGYLDVGMGLLSELLDLVAGAANDRTGVRLVHQESGLTASVSILN